MHVLIGWLLAAIIIWVYELPSDLEKNVARYVCHDKMGVHEVKAIAVGGKVIICKDNSRHNPKDIIIPYGWKGGKQ